MFLASSPLAGDPVISASPTSQTTVAQITSGQQLLAAEMAAGLSISRENGPVPRSGVVVTREKTKGIQS